MGKINELEEQLKSNSLYMKDYEKSFKEKLDESNKNDFEVNTENCLNYLIISFIKL